LLFKSHYVAITNYCSFIVGICKGYDMISLEFGPKYFS